ncbi:MAG TPA: tRNA (N6-isopentenyl adenosine(37)-C2)-methylthiotransferase MiaB, partial [Candidatus Binatia bacterium]|nr:tRNA (N6-isopentenyl adenosine(37)-C2)-methylthiotransferase MiaB [Candidatus Binatia bacterium]
KRLYIQTYGCQMNLYDSDRIAQLMAQQGYVTTETPEEADLLILNTCSVRDKAEQKVYSALGRWRELKEKKPGLVIGVGGCVAQQEGEALFRRAPYLDVVFGTQNIHKLPRMIEEAAALRERPIELAFYRDPSYMEDAGAAPVVHGAKAYVTIMQGCNKVCSFCIVPYVRGRELSRPSAAIIAEIEALAARGVKEIMLLGQNVNSYGKTAAGELSFPELLARIDRIDGVERIRFTTSHPEDLSPGLIDAYANLEKLCEHLHLPVQSGSDSVLKRMRRGYNREEYLERIRRLRDRRPGVALSTDIIVGFPGENEAEFADTLEILQEVEYDDLYAFGYSPRPHTAASKLFADDVPGEAKALRLNQVLRLQAEISRRKNQACIGRTEEILVDGIAKLGRGQMTGRTRANRIVNFPGPVELSGAIAEVRITGAGANSLTGELIGAQ